MGHPSRGKGWRGNERFVPPPTHDASAWAPKPCSFERSGASVLSEAEGSAVLFYFGGSSSPVLTYSRDASRAGRCPSGCSVSRKLTSAVASGGEGFCPYAGIFPPPC